jgi:YVTN family beta-propeller protein
LEVRYKIEHLIVDKIITEERILHLDIRNLENNLLDYNIWIKFAKVLLEKGDYYKSLYEKSNSKSEQAKEILVSMYNKSIDCYDISIKLNPTNIDSWYNKGLALSKLGDYNKAIKCYDKAIEINPNYLLAWNSKGDVLNYLMKFQEAIRSYDRVLEKDSDNIVAWYNKGFALSNLGDYDKAIKCYERTIEINPKNIEALNAKGYALERLGRYEEAIKCYERTIEINPKNIEALNAKGYALERLGRYEEAEQYYNKVTEEYFNEINIIKEKATLYQKLHKYEEAVICYDILLTIDARNSYYALLNKGLALYQLNKFEKAIMCYDRVIGLDRYEEKQKKIGQDLTSRDITQFYHEAIEINPKNIEALNAKGYALERLGRYEEAIKIFSLVREGNPSYGIPALTELNKIYSNYTFQYDKAIDINEQLLKNLSDPETKIDNKLLLAQNLISNNNYEQGRKVAKEVIKVIPKQAIVKQLITRFLVLVSYFLQGRKYDGKVELVKFLAYYRSLSIEIKIEESQWNFKGLVNSIQNNKKIDPSTKTILHNVINLLYGFKDSYKILFQTVFETIEQIESEKRRRKSIQTAIASVVIVATLGFLFAYMTAEANPCSISTSETLSVGNNPLGIDFNPKTNKAYVINEKDRTVSVLDCNVPNYSPYLKYLNINTDTEPKVEASIPLDYPPFDIVIDPETNKVYVLHQSPPSVSVIDGNNNVNLNISIPVGKNPLDIAVNPITHKVYVVNFSSKTLSVINSNNEVEKEIRDVGKKPFSVDVNPNTNKIYVTNEGSNNVLVINETKEKDNRKIIPLPYPSEDIEINPITNKVYVTHSLNNSISIINGVKDDLLKTINVGKNPIRIDAGYNTKEVFVINRGSNSLSIIDGSKDTVINTLKIAGNRPYDIEINPQIKSAYVTNIGDFRGVVNVIKYEEEEDYKYIQVGNKPIDIAVNPKTNKAYVVNNGDGNVSVINGTTNEWIKDIDVGDRLLGVAVDTDTAKVYVTHKSPLPSVSVIDGNNNDTILKENITVGKDPIDIAVNPTTKKVYVVNNGDDNVSVINGTTNEWIKDIHVGKKPVRIDIDTKTNKIYVTNNGSNNVSVINGTTNEWIKDIDVGDRPISVAVNPNTKKVYVGYSNSYELSIINSIDDELLLDNKGQEVKLGFNYPCPSDIAVNLKQNQLFISFDCTDGIILVNDKIISTSTNTTNDKITVTSTKTNTLGKSNTNIAFNPATDKIYVLDTESNLVYTKNTSEL